ncbi:MAG: hypothetical protein ABJO86_19085 [Lentilitoribacter sp.]
MQNSSEDKFVQLPKPLHDMNEKELRAAFKAIDAANNEHHRYLDYSKMKSFQNAALYAPALSDGYINNVTRLARQQQNAIDKDDPSLDPLHEMFKGSEYSVTADDLKFINPKSRLCFYPWVLFSGGQGAKTEALAKKDNWITQKSRDPRVVVIGDSGGFQLQEQTIPFDSKTTPERMLRWLERIADQSMILDFPTGGIGTGAMVPHVEKLKQEGVDVEGLAERGGFSTGYMGCLIRTQQNNDYFAKQRVGDATKLLNVIQGRNEEESNHWYQNIKHYPFEGWAFAGKHSVQLSLTLRRLIQMRDDGLLKSDQWVHFLGVSTLKVGVALSYIQRALRDHTDAENVQITFDSKSPIDSVINGYNSIAGYDFGLDKWSIHTEPTNLVKYQNSNLSLESLAVDWANAGEGRITSQSTLSHMLGIRDFVGVKNANTGKRTPSALQQTLLIHHNTQALIEAFRHAYRFLDDKYGSERPESVQFLNYYIDMIFTCENPMTAIDVCEADLDKLASEGYFGR